MEVEKVYNYLKDGKKVSIRRRYTKTGIRNIKRNELDEYFKNNADVIKESKTLDKILETYNNEHDNKISYSMFYNEYKTIFGFRKNHNKQKQNEEEEHNEEEQQPIKV